MAAKINVLSDELMKRIAAGEVVERPASVVKELIENSIDANALQIQLIIKGAGSDLVQVVDDGDGMSEEDVIVCVAKHATSKIVNVEDLEAIHTLGFRGEALSSIASVSRMVITSRVKEEDEATQLQVDAGAIRDVTKEAANPGTSIEVKNLFHNVPARRKFLKNDATELRHIITAFRRLALAYPQIEFILYVEDEKTMDLKSGSREERLGELLGTAEEIKFVDIEKEANGISLKGYFSKPGEGRKTRTDQFIFLNNRYIVNKSLIHAILSGYGNKLGSNEYPVFALFIEMDPSLYDVNVHPMKIEVRFKDEKFIHDLLFRAMQEAFGTKKVVPDFKLVQGGTVSEEKSEPQLPPEAPKKQKPSFQPPPRKIPEDHGQMTLEAQRPAAKDTPALRSKSRVYQPPSEETSTFWQLHNRYILSQIKSGLTIIDQHVAHERILYERAMASRERQAGLSQQLLFPQTVQLSHEDYLVVTEIMPYLEKIGFGLKEFGKNTVVIESVPVETGVNNEKSLLLEMIDEFKNLRTENDIWEAVAKAFACKSAIKSGEPLTVTEMANLIDQLFATREPYFCPHGRPIVINLPLDEIDKRFGR